MSPRLNQIRAEFLDVQRWKKIVEDIPFPFVGVQDVFVVREKIFERLAFAVGPVLQRL